jgi:hypothetical protein
VLMNLTLPRINEHMTTAVVKTIYPQINTALPLGAKLMDLSIDLSAVRRTIVHRSRCIESPCVIASGCAILPSGSATTLPSA